MRPEHWLKKLRFWLRLVLHRRELEQELDDEIAYHLEAKTEENVAKGMTPEGARRAARIELGGVEQVKENVRSVRAGAWLETLLQDISFGLRMLRKSRGFTAIAVLTLAIGIGVNTTIFTIFNGFLLRPLPVPHADQLVAVAVQEKGFPVGVRGFSYPEFVDIRKQVGSTVDIFANSVSSSEMTINGSTEYCAVSFVSANFFTTLHIKPASGQFILPSQAEEPGVQPTLVLDYSYWQRRFGGAPVLGKQVLVHGMSATIVGIVPKDFRGMFSIIPTDAYLPIGAMVAESPRLMTDRELRMLLVFGRLRDKVRISQTQSEMDVVAARLAQQYPQTTQPSVFEYFRSFSPDLNRMQTVSFFLQVGCS